MKDQKEQSEKINISVSRDPVTGRFTSQVEQPEPEHKPGQVVIQTEKIIPPSGIPSRKILKITGVLGKKDLPTEYLKGPDHLKGIFFLNDQGSIQIEGCISDHDAWDARLIYIDSIYSDYEIQRYVSIMRAAGERLHKINRSIREKAKSWCGLEDIVI
jgi:hypothetical protein